MSFLSVKFLAFLVASFMFYFICPKKFKWVVLLAFSLAYYYLVSHNLIIVLMGITLITYVAGYLLNRNNQKLKNNPDKDKLKELKDEVKKNNKIIQTIAVVLILGTLVFIKYAGFLAENVNLLGLSLPVLSFVLPLGLSFFTLQAISYVIDVSKNKCEGQTNFFKFLLYMAYFPQLTQGPIPRYSKLAPQLYEGHDFDYKRVTYGLQLMGWGFIKKAVLADRLSIVVSTIFDTPENSYGLMVLFGALLYSVQIYGDFSGGIDIIRGISEVFGIELEDNFRQPYFSRSIEEFWRRWHITLGSWMKDYVFYPMSLSRTLSVIGKKARKVFGDNIGKKIPPVIAMFTVYLLVGIWHGASWKYVIYGIWNGVFIAGGILLESKYASMRKSFKVKEDSKGWAVFQMIRTYFICSIGRIFSRAVDTGTAFQLFSNMFNMNGKSISFNELGLDYKNWIVAILVSLLVLYIDYRKEKGDNVRDKIANMPIIVRWVIYYALIFIILIFGYYGPEYNVANFIYGRF
ncbi:MAG: MBOAT family O-acyltransferase [Erysipelotrichaceae bacterium]|nr:MBOAT family O-acyltransferase [Erysipelotrichaceae bacterium]